MRHARSRYEYGRYDTPIGLGIRVGAALVLAGVGILFAAPIGYRLGLLSLPFAANTLFVWGANIAGIGLILASIGLASTLLRTRGTRRGIGRALLAIAVGILAVRAGGRIPFVAPGPVLSDITTDIQHPPEYVALPQARDNSPAMVYPGEAVAARQLEAYPDIQPLTLSLSKDEAFSKALGVVRQLGWKLVSADGPSGHIEASASARLFGTVDDVVVRVSGVDGGSRVDVRSVSRESGSSASASRVRAILQALRPS